MLRLLKVEPSRTVSLPGPRISESKHMIGNSLALLEIALAGNEADHSFAIQTYRTNEVHGLSVCCIGFELEHDVSLIRLEQLISSFFVLKFILPLQFPTENLKSFTKLNIHHVCSCQLGRKRIQKRLSFAISCAFLGTKQLFNSLYRRDCLSRHSQRCRGKTKHALNLTEVHPTKSPKAITSVRQYLGENAASKNSRELSTASAGVAV